MIVIKRLIRLVIVTPEIDAENKTEIPEVSGIAESVSESAKTTLSSDDFKDTVDQAQLENITPKVEKTVETVTVTVKPAETTGQSLQINFA